jgi:dTDP-4-amino-4,6-dideoxygalactose transaminase
MVPLDPETDQKPLMTAPPIPLFRSKLPATEKLVPFLREIDENRQHSNFGPLQRRLTETIEDHLGAGGDGVVLTANGSLALMHALIAGGARSGGLCALPSWTYPATPAAVRMAGLMPWFLDVDEKTWALDPDRVRAALADAPAPVAAILVVAPFGCRCDVDAWDAVSDATGHPVVIDAANGFDGARVGRSPTMVSLHATKALGVGEGGFLASRDGTLIRRVRGLVNHGFTGPGKVELRGVNAKMSEYAAAVGLAAFADWPETRDAYAALQRAYAAALADIPGLVMAPDFLDGWVTSTFNVVLPIDAEPVIEALARSGIEARRWWMDGSHRQPAFADCPRGDLPVTEFLAARVVGLPFFLDLDATDIQRVADELRAIVDQSAQVR